MQWCGALLILTGKNIFGGTPSITFTCLLSAFSSHNADRWIHIIDSLKRKKRKGNFTCRIYLHPLKVCWVFMHEYINSSVFLKRCQSQIYILFYDGQDNIVYPCIVITFVVYYKNKLLVNSWRTFEKSLSKRDYSFKTRMLY